MARLTNVEVIVKEKLRKEIIKLSKYKKRGFGKRLEGVLKEKGFNVS